MIVSIISPDKVSITMCQSFLKAVYGQNIRMVHLNHLLTQEDIENRIKLLNLIQPNPEKPEEINNPDLNKCLLTYFVKKVPNAEPLRYVPSKLGEISDLIIWIDLYSTDWVILKDKMNQGIILMDRWNQNIKRMNAAF